MSVFSAYKVYFSPFPAGISSSQTPDCSYLGLLNHLNLSTTNNVLTIMRPVKNWTTSTLVQIDMLLFGILEVDEKSQTIKTHIWIQMRWTNEFLTWNSSDFCGINMLTVPRSMLWIPDITIQEDASDAGSSEKSQFVGVFPSGLVLADSRQVLTSTCQLNLFRFPFDEQSCNITFSSMNSEEKTINLGTFNNDTILTKYSEMIMITQGEWQLTNMEVEQYTHTQGRLVYMVKITRKPVLYVIILILPLFYLLVLDLASFFIHEARGEKLSFKVTVLLSISVLLLILQDMLPSTEDRLPLIATYCVTTFTLVGVSVLEAMLVSFLIDLEGPCGKTAQSSVDAHVDIQMEADHQKEPVGAEEETGEVKPEKSYPPSDWPKDLLKQILEEVRAAQQEAGRRDNVKTKPGYYRRLAEIIDSVFFVLYFLTCVIFMMFMFILWNP
ncbi:5-hydroxytryptamine receptor 3A-like [Thunnus thynnus]|uniref:5-hydroxytryptamine receptor 3A-like n=1 Tax=Thunnus thynnus TaxID=8237 RepID=UPI00352902D1